MTPYSRKNVVVVGLARSGMAAARLLKRLGAHVALTERDQSPALEISAQELRREGIDVEIGRHSRSFIEGRDLVIISPGVSLQSEPVKMARDLGIDVIGEIELASSVCPAPIIAITGTNGKTTTATLVGEVIKAAGFRAHVLGNIGTPFSGRVSEIRREDFVSLEVSSFQLETIRAFHPRIAVMLNFTPDHLDRYADISEYLEAKKRIFMNQGEGDWLILNYGDEALRPLASMAGSAVLFFNKDESDIKLNQNEMAVAAVARALGIERKICLDVFENFKGVEHRMEFVRNLRDIEFINDSKATNIDSTVWALKNIKRPAVLIAGGRDKGSDFRLIGDLVRQKVRSAVLVGESSEKIAKAWEGLLPVEQAKTLPEAVKLAYRKAQAGECVLFSPMCKSFDMFTDYEHRGRVFKELVNRLT